MSNKPVGGFVAASQAIFWKPKNDSEALLQQHLTTTAQRYCLVGLLALAATPLVYTITRVAAPKRRSTLLDFSVQFQEQGRDGQQQGSRGGDNGKSGTTASGRGTQRADPSGTRVGSVKVSYSGEGGRDALDPHGTPRMHELARRHNSFLFPITRVILANRMSTDAAFGHACATATTAAFLRASAGQLARRLAADIAVHVAMFGVCALVDSRMAGGTDSAQAAGMEASSPPTAANHGGEDAGTAPASVATALASDLWSFGRRLVVGLMAQGLFCNAAGGAAPHMSAYQLYDFAFSVATPLQRCCMPAWAARAVHVGHCLWWLGRPSNPAWVAAEKASTGRSGDGAVAQVWRHLTPKGFFVYFLLRELAQNTVRSVVCAAARGIRFAARVALELGRGHQPLACVDSAWPDDSPSSSTMPSRRRSASGEDTATEAQAKSEAAGKGRVSTVASLARRVMGCWPVASATRDVCFAAAPYVLVATLTLLDTTLGSGEAASGNSLLTYLRSGNGLCFNTLGYLTGAHVVSLLLSR